MGFNVPFLCFDCVRIPRACYSRIAGFLWCHIALVLVDWVFMLSISHLVFPGVGWIILIPSGLLRKTGEAVGATMKVRGLNSAGCASGEPNWQGIGGVVFQVSCSWGPVGLYKKQKVLGGLPGLLREEGWAHSQTMDIRGYNSLLLAYPRQTRLKEIGGTEFLAGCSWGSTGLHKEAGGSWSTPRHLWLATWAQSQAMDGFCFCFCFCFLLFWLSMAHVPLPGFLFLLPLIFLFHSSLFSSFL